jgi:hypothetical protein
MTSRCRTMGHRRYLCPSLDSISILSPQLIDDPPTAPLGTASLGDMFPLATQRGTVALVAWELSITANAYSHWSVLKALKLTCGQFDDTSTVVLATLRGEGRGKGLDLTYVVCDNGHIQFFAR